MDTFMIPIIMLGLVLCGLIFLEIGLVTAPHVCVSLGTIKNIESASAGNGNNDLLIANLNDGRQVVINNELDGVTNNKTLNHCNQTWFGMKLTTKYKLN